VSLVYERLKATRADSRHGHGHKTVPVYWREYEVQIQMRMWMRIGHRDQCIQGGAPMEHAAECPWNYSKVSQRRQHSGSQETMSLAL